MMAESSSSSSSAIKRACDACHRRKVKCAGDGTRTCRNCTAAGLSCTYNAIPQKKGPKGSRAKIISELRETQRQSTIKDEEESPPPSPAYTRKSGLLSLELITTCVDYFFKNLYPTQPILHRQKVGEIVGQMEVNAEAYCFVVALCAYMLIQPNIEDQPSGAKNQSQPPTLTGHTLLHEAIRVRKGLDLVESPTVLSVITSLFLFGSHVCLDRQNRAWFHLREATTLALLIRMHDETTYQTPDIIENTRKRRLYWLLFVTERAYALQHHRPVTLHATIDLPTRDEDPSEAVELNGFIHLVKLFRPFDDAFVGLWNSVKRGATPDFFLRLQQQLSEALPTYLESAESQAVDLRCSQQWLRTMVWQLSISHGFLSSTATENAMSFTFPIEISRDLVTATSQFTRQAMEVHGIGLIEKLFDVACTLTDVISCVPYQAPAFEYAPRDYLQQLVTLISTLRGGRQRFVPLLMTKIHETIPDAPAYSLAPAPPSARSEVEDVFEGVVEGSHGTLSVADSAESSTPFCSPPLAGFGGPQVVSPFAGVMHGAQMVPEHSGGFPGASGAMSVSAPGQQSQMYMDAAFGPTVKYESDG